MKSIVRTMLDVLLIPLDYMFLFMEKRVIKRKNLIFMKANLIHPSVSLGRSILDLGHIEIGEGTYLNQARITAGPKGRVQIGKYCAIGSNVSIKARTHDPSGPTPTPDRQNIQKYADITIGDHVWIGDNVFIREGVSVGDYAIIGANSVVTRDIPAKTIVGGVPAKILKKGPK